MKRKILIFDRMNSNQFPGGDTVQIAAIKEFLSNEGYEVELSSDPLKDLSFYDYIFVFNLTNPLEAYIYVKRALQYNKPYIIFPVYWNLDKLKMNDSISPKSIIKKVLPTFIKSYMRGQKFIKTNNKIIKSLKLKKKYFYDTSKILKFILNNAFYICPNSYAEWEHLKDHFRISSLNSKVGVVYNGVNLKIKHIKEDKKVKEQYGLPDNYICCVGGIGPRKNQLNLIRAVKKLNVNIVLIGKVAKGYEKYGKLVKDLAGDNVYFLGLLSQEEALKVVKCSVGHIQPSFIETPGLASLEAAALNIPIVVAGTDPVKEYFGDNAIYCNPSNIKSISNSLRQLIAVEKYNNTWIDKYEWNKSLEPLLIILRQELEGK